LRFDAIEIDDHILDKIETRHAVAFEEVLEACEANERHVRRGSEGLYKVFSRTNSGRYLLVVLARHERRIWRVVTARQMTLPERRMYQRSQEE
jgi:uncharacterized DUF497 family protein